jgi:predicted nucleotidyltransferase
MLENASSDSDLVRRLTATLAGRGEILEAYLFGSVARGDFRKHSDLDVAVYVDPSALEGPGFGLAAELGADLAHGLGRNDVDVVILNTAPPVLYHRVLRDGVRLLSRDLRATTAREGRALSRYCDYVPQLRKIERAHRARIASGGFGR